MSNEVLGRRITFERMCTRCDYKWYPKQWNQKENKQIDPKNCPNPTCKSKFWDRIPVRPHSAATKAKIKKAWKISKSLSQ